MEHILAFWHRLLTDLGLDLTRSNCEGQFNLDSELLEPVQNLAEQDSKPVDEVIADLLSFALAHRTAAEENLKRWQSLSPREREVAALVCQELTNRQVAAQLHISPETVKTHLRHILRKLGLQTRYELRQALRDWDFSAWLNP